MPFSSNPTTTRPPATTTGRRMRFGSLAIMRMASAREGGFSFIFFRRIELVARVQEFLVVALADQLFKLRGAEPLFRQIAKIELEAAILHELSRLAAGRTIRLVQEKRAFRSGFLTGLLAFRFAFLAAMFNSLSSSISRHARINIGGPAIDPAGHGSCPFDPLRAHPRRGVEAAHAVMAEKNNLACCAQAPQIRRNLAQRNQNRTFDARGFMLPFLTHVHQQKCLAASQTFAPLPAARSRFAKGSCIHSCSPSPFSSS